MWNQIENFENASSSSGSDCSQALSREYVSIEQQRQDNRRNGRDGLLPVELPMTPEQKMDLEISRQPADVQEWLDRIAKEIHNTGKLPDDLKKAFEGKGQQGDIKLQWLNRLLERMNSPYRLDLYREGAGGTLELQRDRVPVEKYHHVPNGQGSRPYPESSPPPNGIFEDNADDDTLPIPPLDVRGV